MHLLYDVCMLCCNDIRDKQLECEYLLYVYKTNKVV